MNQPKYPPQSNNNLKWWLLGGAGVLAILCLCVVAVGGFILISNKGEISLPFMDAASEPATETGPGPAPTLSSNQYMDDTTLIDDFSSNALGWPEYDDGTTIIKYENEAYSIRIAEPDYYDWASAPVSFSPTYIEFDVWGLPGEQNGTVGVMCQIQDADNHYYIELDLGFQEFIAATIIDGEVNYLTGSGSEDEVWEPAIPLNSSPDLANRVKVTCTTDQLSLDINGTLVYATDIPGPHLPAGEIGLFAFANEDASEGYQVYFDNVVIVK